MSYFTMGGPTPKNSKSIIQMTKCTYLKMILNNEKEIYIFSNTSIIRWIEIDFGDQIRFSFIKYLI